MAFDLQPVTFTLEADLDPYGAVLLAGAAIALEHDIAEWWDTCIIPCEQTFRAAEAFGDPDVGPCESGEVACCLLLLMREGLRHM